MPKLKASEISPGDVIVLQDGKTRVTVTETLPVVNAFSVNSSVSIAWEYLGQRRYMVYLLTDEIEVIQ